MSTNPFRSKVYPSFSSDSISNGAKLLVPGQVDVSITDIQKRLKELGVFDGPISEKYDQLTEDAVKRFQLSVGIDADGKVGRETQLKLFGKTIPPDLEKLNTALSETENFRLFGDFRVVGWWLANLVFLDLHEFRPLLGHVEGLMFGDRIGFDCHRLVAPHFYKAIELICGRGLTLRLREIDGCFKVRLKRTRSLLRNDSDWSNHCWGIAIDINSTSSPLGRPLGSASEQVDPELASCFEDAGFYWGGRNIEETIDSMHFQFCYPVALHSSRCICSAPSENGETAV